MCFRDVDFLIRKFVRGRLFSGTLRLSRPQNDEGHCRSVQRKIRSDFWASQSESPNWRDCGIETRPKIPLLPRNEEQVLPQTVTLHCARVSAGHEETHVDPRSPNRSPASSGLRPRSSPLGRGEKSVGGNIWVFFSDNLYIHLGQLARETKSDPRDILKIRKYVLKTKETDLHPTEWYESC